MHFDHIEHKDEELMTYCRKIMYSKSKIVTDSGTEIEALTFGPVSVLPTYQKRGVGSALIRHTLEIAKGLGFAAVLIFGHESYYPRFGFRPASEYGIITADGKSFPAFMALPLQDGALDGITWRFYYADIFDQLDKDEAEALNKKLAEPMDIDEYIATHMRRLAHRNTGAGRKETRIDNYKARAVGITGGSRFACITMSGIMEQRMGMDT